MLKKILHSYRAKRVKATDLKWERLTIKCDKDSKETSTSEYSKDYNIWFKEYELSRKTQKELNNHFTNLKIEWVIEKINHD